MIRYIEVRVTPFHRINRDGPDTHEVEITVRTEDERISRRETLPDATFTTHLQWMLKRIEQEITRGCCEN